MHQGFTCVWLRYAHLERVIFALGPTQTVAME